MKIELELITDAELLALGYTHSYTTIRPDGIAVRAGLTKGMTAEKLAALFAGESIRDL